MENSNVACYIYRAESDESNCDMATIAILIPRHKVVVPNQSGNDFWVSKERKLKVYEKVYERFGEPPEELTMLPNIEVIQNEEDINEDSVWTYVRCTHFDGEFEVISTLTSLQEALRPNVLNRIVIPLSDLGFFWICEFCNLLQEMAHYDNYVSIMAETA